MKKFKVIEKSRFLTYEEASNIKGGVTQCNSTKQYSSCGLLSINYITCGPGVVSGYSWTPKGESCGGNGIFFKTTNCGGIQFFSTTCEGNNIYSGNF